VSIVVCVELLLMYQIPHGEVHILHIYICVHTPHVRDTGRSPHGAGPGATGAKLKIIFATEASSFKSVSS
jgi:hypothetical protein